MQAHSNNTRREPTGTRIRSMAVVFDFYIILAFSVKRMWTALHVPTECK